MTIRFTMPPAIAAFLVVAAFGTRSLQAQSATVGRVILEERFESGDDTSRKRFLGPSFNIPDTWEMRDGAVASIFDPATKKGHGHAISPRCGARDIRVSYRVPLDSETSSLSVVVDGDWPNKTGLPLCDRPPLNGTASRERIWECDAAPVLIPAGLLATQDR